MNSNQSMQNETPQNRDDQALILRHDIKLSICSSNSLILRGSLRKSKRAFVDPFTDWNISSSSKTSTMPLGVTQIRHEQIQNES
jgi:hypothetical protein